MIVNVTFLYSLLSCKQLRIIRRDDKIYTPLLIQLNA